MKTQERILFVDDDEHLTRIVGDFLKHEHYDVRTAGSAEDAIKVLEKFQPDLIVLDISMPGMGGIGFLKRISNPDGTLKYSVLVLTARAVMKDFFDSVAVDGFLPKPCSELDLIRKIRAILTERQLGQPQLAVATAGEHAIRVVIGEDDPDMGRLYLQMFKDCGFEVHLEKNGPEVLERTVALHPSVIIMKDLLPNMNGSVVARLIKTMPTSQHTPIIVHDTTRSTKPAPENIQSVDVFMFSSLAQDLINAVRGVLH